ncbi:MAG: hypothetical protein LBI35_02585 [Burkholderiales bacterium]|jgi:hypothetical protein|nr:hypothetical protein [Burkholderiales bacterium]
MELGILASIDNGLRRFYQWYTQARAAKLDNLDNLNAPLSDVLALLATRSARRKVVIIDVPCTGNFIVPADVTLLWLSMCGGGGGGLTLGSDGVNNIGGGMSGGSGASVVKLPIPVTPGQSISYIVGEGGAGLGGYTAGLDVQAPKGGDSVFGDITAPGGLGGAGMYESYPNINQTLFYLDRALGGRFTKKAFSFVGYGVFDSIGDTENGTFVNGKAGAGGKGGNSAVGAVNPTTPLAGFNFAGVGGLGFVRSNTGYRTKGGNGVIVLEMETSF